MNKKERLITYHQAVITNISLCLSRYMVGRPADSRYPDFLYKELFRLKCHERALERIKRL